MANVAPGESQPAPAMSVMAHPWAPAKRMRLTYGHPVELVLEWMDAALGMFGLCNLLASKLLIC